MRVFSETRKLEVRDHADVVVIGGGPSGVVSAIAAARHGMDVMLIEKNAILGGLSTAGHVCLFEPLCDGKGKKVTSGMVEEMLFRSIAYSYNTLPPKWGKGIMSVENPDEGDENWDRELMDRPGRFATLFNVPAFALALEESVRQENIKIMYDTLFCEPIMEEDSCVGVIVENVSGRYVISCSALIDASGYCLAFYRAGTNCVTNKNRFTFECYDSDLSRMKAALESGHIQKAINWRVLGWNPVISDPAQANEFEGTTAEDINQYLYMSHSCALDFLKQQGKDYAMLSLPTMPQIRMVRRIKGQYEMRPDDVFRTMEDSIGCVSDWRRSGPVYEVPYRCMLDLKIKNMIATGRNIAAQNDTWDIMRCYPGAMTTGQAAGTAAAIAVKKKLGFGEVAIEELQKELEKDGVIIHI